MLSYALVLLVATSALAAPTIDVNPYNIYEVVSVPDNGRLVNKHITDGTLEYIDTGDVSLYINVLVEAIHSLADSADPSLQAAAVLQTIGVVGELANGIPGDACQSAAVINAFASGDNAGLRSAVARYGQRVASYIDTIVQLIVNPNAVRFSSGPKGNCLAGGRTYAFEGAWDAVLGSASPSQYRYLNEEYCATKRLYSAFNSRSNNVAATVLASNIKPVNRAAQRALGPLAGFLRSVADGGNVAQAGALAKRAFISATA